MFLRTKRGFSLFLACAFMLSILCNGVDAAVATLLSPKANETYGKIVDVTAKYDSQSNKVLIDSATLYVDNAVYTSKKLNPAKQGVVSFDWNTTNYSKGQHYIRVALFAKGKKVTEVTGYGIVSASEFDTVAPKVSLTNVKENEIVSGTKMITISAKDDSGEAPIVSLLVDKKLKLMQNTQPYSYALDTTALADGKHVVEVYAFDLEGNQSDIASYTINVANGNKADSVQANAPIVVADNTEKKLSSRPSLSVNSDYSAGRISDSEVSASLNSVKTAAVAGGNGIKAPEKTSANTEIILGKAPVKSTSDSLNAPKIKTVSEPKNVLVAKKISDNSVVAGELKIAADIKTSNIMINAPKATVTAPKAVVTAPKAEVKKDVPVLVAKNISGNSVADSSVKIAVKSDKAAFDVNTPKETIVAGAPAVKKEVKVVKAEVKKEVKTAPATGKAKIRDLVNADNGVLLWDNKTKTVTAYVNNVKVELKIGSKKATVDGKAVTINFVPVLKNGRTIIDITDYKTIKAPALKK